MTKIIIVTLIFIVTAIGANADVIDDPWASSHLSYLFHLYYDNDQLFADRDFEFKYDIIAEEFIPEQFTTQFPFSGGVVNLKGETAATFKFDPRRGNPNFLKGKISVKAPYVSDGQKVIFYDAQNGPLVTVFVSESSFCNDDGVCNSERGEDGKTCPNDCAGTPVPIPPPVEGKGLSGMVWTLIVLILALVGVGGWYGWRWWQKKRTAVQPDQFTDKLP